MYNRVLGILWRCVDIDALDMALWLNLKVHWPGDQGRIGPGESIAALVDPVVCINSIAAVNLEDLDQFSVEGSCKMLL